MNRRLGNIAAAVTMSAIGFIIYSLYISNFARKLGREGTADLSSYLFFSSLGFGLLAAGINFLCTVVGERVRGTACKFSDLQENQTFRVIGRLQVSRGVYLFLLLPDKTAGLLYIGDAEGIVVPDGNLVARINKGGTWLLVEVKDEPSIRLSVEESSPVPTSD